jgi:hypothetical protein
MQYAVLIYESPTVFAERGEETAERRAYVGAWREYHRSLVEAGVYVGGNPLERPETGTTIRVKPDGRQIQDGPYANTKEQLGGFLLLELDTLDAALEWASKCPAASYGAVEVRPVANVLHDTIVQPQDQPRYSVRPQDLRR